MKKILYVLLSFFLLASCAEEQDNRAYEGVKVVAVRLDGVLYTDFSKGAIILKPGVNLKAVKTEILVANGKLTNFENNMPQDLRFPIDIALDGADGNNATWKLIVQSPPNLISLDIAGLAIPKENTYFSATSIITQVPVGTDITKLAVTYTFSNGTLKNYVNGIVTNYTNPFKLEVLGIDGTTTYKYDVIFTTDPVGPAVLKGMTINGIPATELLVIDAAKAIYQPKVPYLSDFVAATVTLQPGAGCTVDPTFVNTNLNLLLSFKVKITGTNGIVTTFTIMNPLLESTPIFEKSHTDLQYAANAGSSAAFSNGKVLIASHSMNAGSTATLGINAYDLAGNYISGLSKTGTNFDGGAVTGIRKMATDSNGKILGVQLGAGAGATTVLTIFKWNAFDDAAPTPYITYTQTSLGLAYSPRSAGINISGSLDGNAVITVQMSGKQDVFVWKVTGGVLNTTPVLNSFPYSGVGNYSSIEPFEGGFVGASSGINFSGINLMGSSMAESFKTTGIPTTDARAILYKGRKYVGYTALIGGKGVFRIVDVTTASQYALDNPIMNIVGKTVVANANLTVDSDFAVIGGKLHVLFYGTNDRVAVYKLEQ